MKIRLTDAYVWDCPNCGKRNLEVPPIEEHEVEVEDEHGNSASGFIKGQLVPESVLCADCLTYYEVDLEELD